MRDAAANDTPRAGELDEEEVQAIKTFQQHMRGLLDDGIGDFRLVVEAPEGEHTLTVWGALLRRRSEVFDRMLSHNFAEAQENALRLEGFTLPEVRGFLEFVYTGSLRLQGDSVAGVLALADKYHVRDLEGLCRRWVRSHLTVEGAGALYLAALRHRASGCVAEECLLFMDGLAPEVLPHLHNLPDEELDMLLSRETFCITDRELADALVGWVECGHRTAEEVAPLLRRHAALGLLDPQARARLLPRLTGAGLEEWAKQASHAPSRAMRSPGIFSSLRAEYEQAGLGSPFLGYWVVVVPSAATLLQCQSCCVKLAGGGHCHDLEMAGGDSLSFFVPHRRARPLSFRVSGPSLDSADGFRACPMSFSGSLDGVVWQSLVPNTAASEPLPRRAVDRGVRFACHTSQVFRWFKVEAMDSLAFRCLDIEGILLPS